MLQVLLRTMRTLSQNMYDDLTGKAWTDEDFNNALERARNLWREVYPDLGISFRGKSVNPTPPAGPPLKGAPRDIGPIATASGSRPPPKPTRPAPSPPKAASKPATAPRQSQPQPQPQVWRRSHPPQPQPQVWRGSHPPPHLSQPQRWKSQPLSRRKRSICRQGLWMSSKPWAQHRRRPGAISAAIDSIDKTLSWP